MAQRLLDTDCLSVRTKRARVSSPHAPANGEESHMKKNSLWNESIRNWIGPIPLLLGVVFAAALLGGCKEEGSTPPTAPSPVAEAAREGDDPNADGVAVSESGTKFEPPIDAGQVPEGAWMCDMNGQVHYASKTRGDGKCPVCSMALVQKGSGQHEHHEETVDQDE